MKNVSATHVKQMVSILGEGFSNNASIEGREQTKHSNAQSMVRTGLEIQDWYLKMISDMHQKLGTFSWYSPRCTGNIAYITLLRLCTWVSQGSQMMVTVAITMVA